MAWISNISHRLLFWALGPQSMVVFGDSVLCCLRDMERSWRMSAFESYPTPCSDVPVSRLLHCEQAAASGSCHREYSSYGCHVCLLQGNRNRSSGAEPKQASCLLFLLGILSERKARLMLAVESPMQILTIANIPLRQIRSQD